MALALAGAPFASAAQTGIITGRVVDAATSSPLANAEVYVEGTNFGTLTSAEGVYRIVTPRAWRRSHP